MAKRNTKAGMYQQRQPQPKRRAPDGKPASKTASKTARASSTRSYTRTEQQPTPRVPAQASLLTVRIAAIVIAVASIAGAIAWIVSLKGSFEIAQVIGLILLGFLAGLGLLIAVRPAQIVANVAKMMKDRR